MFFKYATSRELGVQSMDKISPNRSIKKFFDSLFSSVDEINNGRTEAPGGIELAIEGALHRLRWEKAEPSQFFGKSDMVIFATECRPPSSS
ncbi:hypothetical protein RLW55_20170 [Hyphomicrobium sp. B1]|uniref:hypothetical protein n=1 Tax=Hyphomicrobium sp. B1 TaxID=3075651 RepID=UPI003C2D6E2A